MERKAKQKQKQKVIKQASNQHAVKQQENITSYNYALNEKC